MISYTLRVSVPDENWHQFDHLLTDRPKPTVLDAYIELSASTALLHVTYRGQRRDGTAYLRRTNMAFDLGTTAGDAAHWLSRLLRGHSAEYAAAEHFWPEIMASSRIRSQHIRERADA